MARFCVGTDVSNFLVPSHGDDRHADLGRPKSPSAANSRYHLWLALHLGARFSQPHGAGTGAAPLAHRDPQSECQPSWQTNARHRLRTFLRGFEAGGANTPSIFVPWYKVGTAAQVTIGTDRSSPFDRNPVALKVEVLCDKDDEKLNTCPKGGVGAANPGFWGMNILAGSKLNNTGTGASQGQGFRKELAKMISDLKPGFLRFPGGCYVEGTRMTNAFRWRDSVGPYENRPGHYGDVWNYWSDDGFGYYEGLQLAENLGAAPVWVFNNGISHEQSVPTEVIGPFIQQDVLDGIEFARGPANSTWGAVRAKMGHPEPFYLHHVAIGNEDCWKPYYRGNYMEFYKAIKLMYPDIQIISNCDGSSAPLDHPAKFYDFHGFVSENAVTVNSGHGNLLASLAEGAFLIGIELNKFGFFYFYPSDVRSGPSSYALLKFLERVALGSVALGTRSYWVQLFFKNSNGAHLVPSTIQADSSTSLASLITSAIRTHKASNGLDYLIVKAVNFGNCDLNLDLEVSGVSANRVVAAESYITLMTSEALMDENTFMNPVKVTPQVSKATNAGPNMQLSLPAYSIIALELGLSPTI